MGPPPSQSHLDRSALRLTAVDSSDSDPQRREWQVDFNVRGERVPGRLFSPERADTDLAPFAIWVRGRADQHPEHPPQSAGMTVLELSWPLLGARHDVKLSSLLIRSLSEAEPSSAQEALWKRFCDQAAHEVAAARSGMEAQTHCPVGPFSELVLELGFEGKAAKRSVWSAPSGDEPDPAQWVRDFLDEVRSPTTG